jgi:hypothetical protein
MPMSREMVLRPALLLCALALLAPGCGSGGEAAPAVATPHLAEGEVATRARGDTNLQLAWAKALRVASAADLTKVALLADADVSRPNDWYLVQTCSFGANAGGYWSNPVDHRVVTATGDAAPADLPAGACDPDAGSPPPPRATGDPCVDSWNMWIVTASAPFRQAASAATEAFTSRLDGRCLIVLIADSGAVDLTEEAGGSWSFLDANQTPPDPNAVVHGDGTIAPR